MAEAANDVTCIDAIRCLAADVVQKANSGHPGMPIGMAPAAHVVWSEFLNVDPQDTQWINRDRFIISNGHGCALQYIMLHLAGFPMTMDDLKSFRQLKSITPGHPEREMTPGIEVTTGPLGQGIANGVGIAIAQKHLAARFNKENFNLSDHFVYIFCGDGCLMEGVALEAVSMAGHLGLDNIILIYDDNKITIDGHTYLAFTEDVPKRMEACGWYTTTVKDGNTDVDAIRAAIEECRQVKGKPKMISLQTIIGYGAPNQDTHGVHGAPLGAPGVKELKKKFGRDQDAAFNVEESVYARYKQMQDRCRAKRDEWNELFEKYAAAHAQDAAEFTALLTEGLPEGWEAGLPTWKAGTAVSTRKASEAVLNGIAPKLEALIGGSADLTPSTLTAWKEGCVDFQKDTPNGRYIRYGVREHAMSAIGNGLAAYGIFIPFVSTFFNFIGYALGAVRLSAMSHLGVIYVATHDSIGLGEDGPTHQPIEIAAALRATPNLILVRPADATETAGAWALALRQRGTPTIMALSRQDLPVLENSSADKVSLGAYPVYGSTEGADLVVLASGSEVSSAVAAAQAIDNGFKVAVVSFPSWELFDKQPEEYKKTILPDNVPIVSVEAWAPTGWEKYSHVQLGMRSFGYSAPWKDVYQAFGFDAASLKEKFQTIASHFKDEANRKTLGSKLLRTHF